MTTGTFLDRYTGETLLQIELSSPEANCYRSGDTIWVARESDPGDKTFLVDTTRQESLDDLNALEQSLLN